MPLKKSIANVFNLTVSIYVCMFLYLVSRSICLDGQLVMLLILYFIVLRSLEVRNSCKAKYISWPLIKNVFIKRS